MAIWHMDIASWIPRLHRHSAYIILIAFPLQQWLHERASVLRFTYIACLVFIGDCLKGSDPNLAYGKLKKAAAAGP